MKEVIFDYGNVLLCLNGEVLYFSVVDVVRTDNHLEFYEDTRNLARMSDILAVYAWVDPATGYCQGMYSFLFFVFLVSIYFIFCLSLFFHIKSPF